MEVVLNGGGWRRQVRVARSFRERLVGLIGSADGASLLLKTSSVHGFGMRRELSAIGLDRSMQVLGVKTLKPNRVVGFKGARYILELPVDADPPPVGLALELTDV